MATGYGNSLITSGLVHLVDAANPKSWTGTGTSWLDLSGNDRTGTLNNGLVWNTANEGSLQFDGSNDYVSFPNDIYSTLTTTTFSVWFYLNGTSTWQRVYDFGRGQALNIFFSPTSGGGVPRFVINIGAGEQQLNDTTSVSTGVWYNYVVTTNGTQAQMFRNGSLVATNTSFTYTPASLGSTTQTWFGRSQYPDPYLNGRIAQFAVYNRVLTAGEIQQNFNVMKNRFYGTRPFSPTDISGLQLWLDADDPRTLYSNTSGTTKATTDGTTVALWVDKSGNAYNASQSNASYVPTFKQSIQNGRNILRFDGANDHLNCGDVIEPASTISIFAVAKAASTGQYCVFSKGGSGNYYNAYTLFFNVSGTNTHASFNTGAVGTGLSLSSTTGQYYLLEGTYNGSAMYHYQNGNPTTTALSGNLVYNSDNLRIGSMSNGAISFPLNGDIGEILIYNTALSAANRIKIETYLNNKWGLWSSFTPSSISGLQLWLDSSDPATLYQDTGGLIPAFNDGDPVALWKDKSGNARNASQSTADYRPALKTSVQNSKNGIRFDGTNDFLSGAYGTTFSTWSLFVVCKFTSASLYPMVYTDGNNELRLYSGTGILEIISQNDPLVRDTVSCVGSAIIATPINGSSFTLYKNGISLGTGVTQRALASTFYISSRGGSNYYMVGDVYEIIAYNAELTTTQRQQVEQYLNQKWGVF